MELFIINILLCQVQTTERITNNTKILMCTGTQWVKVFAWLVILFNCWRLISRFLIFSKTKKNGKITSLIFWLVLLSDEL